MLLKEAKEITWSDYFIATGDKLGSTPRTIEIVYDAYNAGGGYVNIKIAANYSDAPIGDGELTGGTFNPDDKGAVTEGLAVIGTVNAVVTYKPTDAEWMLMTKTGGENPNGLYINGYGARITKITLK